MASDDHHKNPIFDQDELYEDAADWHVNTGGETIHAKRQEGRFRTYKWLAASTWILFFIGPYFRWNGKQAVFFDIPGRQFHIFDITILPQDVWMLSLTLLFFAILLAAVTTVVGRAYCGYFCFQTIWTDVFTWIEEKLEGSPAKRRKADKLPLSKRNIPKLILKHAIWIFIGAFTGLSFTLWFGDAYELWGEYLTLTAGSFGWASIGVFAFFTYLFAGWMREQVCFWLCPYARIQAVMVDVESVIPTYDYMRGEPRGRMLKGKQDPEKGDCVDCNLCVAVCPTGVDIRGGLQEGCITCGLCIDACNDVMRKVGKEGGLIRYMSHVEAEGKEMPPLYKRPRPILYFIIMIMAAAGIAYGMTHLGSIELHVLHERQPLFVQQSDGSIQNKYELKILNKTDKVMQVKLEASGPEHMTLVDMEDTLKTQPGRLTAYTVFIRIKRSDLNGEREPVVFTVSNATDSEVSATYESMFFGPKVY